MINITVIALGSLKEKYFREAADEYKKRLSGICKITETELRDERLPASPSQAEIDASLEREAVKIRAALPNRAFTVAMCIEGKEMSSVEFADVLDRAPLTGASNAVFILGSSYGISEKLKKECNMRLSMSKMTFPHKLARVMLYEAIYRAAEITSGSKYHK